MPPTPRPEYTAPTSAPDGLTMSAEVARSMLAWASDDTTRPQLCGLAISVDRDPWVCACDGHVGIRVKVGGTDLGPSTAVWSRAYVEQQLGIAKALKASTVTLAWSAIESGLTFPPMGQVIPRPGSLRGTVVTFNPDFMRQIGELGQRVRKMLGSSVAIAVRHIGGALDPLRCDVVAAHVGIVAECVVMPMRCDEFGEDGLLEDERGGPAVEAELEAA